MDENDWSELLKNRQKTHTSYLPVVGGKYSENGKNPRTVAICVRCINEIGQPYVFKNEGASGVRSCDWCGILNYLGLPEDEQIRLMPAPIFQANINDDSAIEVLKSILGKDALNEKFSKHSVNEAWSLIADELREANANLHSK